MDEDAAIWKLLAIYLVWLLASVAIALIAGLISFIVLAVLPFLLRRRMSDKTDEEEIRGQ